ncbi:MAG: hypothetical protein K6A42_11865 [Treponema sp.]|nr:hypothetical protein [Treponema sp.]
MKKFFVLLGTLAVAALFFSCANSSDDNSAALLGLQNPATKNTVSKTIKIGGVEYSYTIVDGQPQASGGVSVAADGTVTITAADGSKVAVKGETITYTTADSKVYVGSGSSGDITLVNQANPNDKITATFSSQTKTESPQQKQSVADHLPPSVGTNELAGKTFTSAGYTIKFEADTYTTITQVSTTNTLTSVFSYTYNSNLKVIYYTEKKENGASGATPNGGRNTADFIWIKSYSISGNTLKILDSNRYPAGKDFSELYNYYSALPWQIKDNSNNTVYNLYCSLAAGSSYTLNADSLAYQQIMAKSDGLLAYKVSSVDANAIHTCATGTRADTNAEFSFTDENKEFKYTMTKSENGAVVDIEGLGKINIVYATPATIPDFTSATGYTLQ